MRKSIMIGVLAVLVLATVIGATVVALKFRNSDMDSVNGEDVPEVVDANGIMARGGLIVFCEMDLFCTVYYFLVKQKTLAKSMFMILSQLLLPIVLCSRYIAKFLHRCAPDIFVKDVYVVIALVLIYYIIRSVCIAVCTSEDD